TDTANSSMMPSATRWAISLRICIGRSALLQPDAGGRPQVGGFMVRVTDPALDLFAPCVEEVVEHRQDQPTIVANLQRRVLVKLGAPGLVELRAGLEDDLVEALIKEAGVVPVRARCIGGRIHGILCRPAAPIGGAEWLLVPDLGPIAIARLTLDLYFDAALRSLLLEQLRGVDCAREGYVSGTKKDGAIVARLLEVELGLVGVIGALLDP